MTRACSRTDCAGPVTHKLVVPESGGGETVTWMCADHGSAAFSEHVRRGTAAALICVDRDRVCQPEGA